MKYLFKINNDPVTGLKLESSCLSVEPQRKATRTDEETSREATKEEN